MKIRKMHPEDLDAVQALVDRTFQPVISLAEVFPTIFSKNNRFSYLLEKKGEIISFVGVVPIVYKEYYGVSIGSVATDPKYQGRGCMSKLFRFVIQDLKRQGLDFALISGDQNIYLENGAQYFGEFYRYDIQERSSHHDLSVARYEGNLEGLFRIHSLLKKEEPSFEYGINELSQFLYYQSWAEISSLSYDTCLLRNNCGEQSFLTYGIKNKQAEIIEYGGEIENIVEFIPHLNYHYDLKKTIFVTKKKLASWPYKKIKNQGTIVVWNKELDANQLPYTQGYRFI